MIKPNPHPLDIETNGVLRKLFPDPEDGFAWWESNGEGRYRYVAISTNNNIFMAPGDWYCGNNPIELVKVLFQMPDLSDKLAWHPFDSKHPVMGGDDWFMEPDGWWEIEELPAGFRNFDVVDSLAYTEGDSPDVLLGKNSDRDAILSTLCTWIIRTNGVPLEPETGMPFDFKNHDINFIDTTIETVASVIGDFVRPLPTNTNLCF